MRLLICFCVLLITGCASNTYRDLENIHPGMDKDQVLDRAGNPKRTFRSNSQDHWIYVYFHDNEEWARQIDFAGGKVHKVGLPLAKHSLEKALEEADSMEEYEATARAHQKKSSGFKDIDGGASHANGE
jgi:hypothetical protein